MEKQPMIELGIYIFREMVVEERALQSWNNMTVDVREKEITTRPLFA